MKWLKSFCYNSHEVLCGGCIYSLYVDAVVILAWYVHTDCIYNHHAGPHVNHNNKMILAISL